MFSRLLSCSLVTARLPDTSVPTNHDACGNKRMFSLLREVLREVLKLVSSTGNDNKFVGREKA